MHVERRVVVGHLGFPKAMRHLRESLVSPEGCWCRSRPPWRGMEGYAEGGEDEGRDE